MPATIVYYDTEIVELVDTNNNSMTFTFTAIKELNKLIKPYKNNGTIKRRQKKSVQFVLAVQK